MSNVIRKIFIGPDYRNGAMAYSVGQEVYGGHKVHCILLNEEDSSYTIYISKNEELMPWKTFNKQMAITIEYDLAY